MLMNGQWKPSITITEFFVEAIAEAVGSVITAWTTPTMALRPAATYGAFAQLYICSTDHWFNQPE